MTVATPILRPPPVRDLTYAAVRALLTRGELPPERRIVEGALALQLGVSRTPVREALARLASEGFLIAAAGGYRVPVIEADDIVRMSELRGLLEPEAARQAARAAGGAGLSGMASAIAAERAAHAAADGDAFADANRDFRVAWAGRVPNPMLLEALARSMCSLQLLRHRTMALAPLRASILAGHAGLLERIRAGDAEGAAAWQTRSVMAFRDLVLASLFGR